MVLVTFIYMYIICTNVCINSVYVCVYVLIPCMYVRMCVYRKEVLCHFAESQAGGDGSGSGGGGVTTSDSDPGLPEPPPSYDDYLKSLEATRKYISHIFVFYFFIACAFIYLIYSIYLIICYRNVYVL